MSSSANEFTIVYILNQDCWLEIFSYVPFNDVIRSARVSKQWRCVVSEYLSGCRTLKTSWCPELTTAGLKQLLWRYGAKLTRLHIDSGLEIEQTNDNLVPSRSFCPNLKELEIYGNDVKHFYYLAVNCTKLHTIYLYGTATDSTDIFLEQCFNHAFSVEQLSLDWNSFDGRFLTVKNIQNIKYLVFNRCDFIDISYLFNINNLNNLTTLKIDDCGDRLWLSIFKIINNLTQLQELSLCEYLNNGFGPAERNSIEKQLVRALSKLCLLKHLYLRNNVFVTNEVVKQIAQSCNVLETLDVLSTRFIYGLESVLSDESVIAVCLMCDNLQSLDVSGQYLLSAQGIAAAVSQATKLMTLKACFIENLDTASVSACLRTCPTLKKLEVWGCNKVTSEVVDAAVASLQQHPRPLVLCLPKTIAGCEMRPKHCLLTIDTSRALFY